MGAQRFINFEQHFCVSDAELSVGRLSTDRNDRDSYDF
jgi:hypothetical protein